MNNFKTILKASQLLAVAALIAYLSGCANPNALGLNNNQWQRLTPAQQKTYSKNYHSIKTNLAKQNKQKSATANFIDDNGLPDVDLTILNGQAAFAPTFNFQPIAALHIHLKYGMCQSALLSAQQSNQKATLWFCYLNKMIGIDPSFYNLKQAWGTVFIDANPLWNHGYSYKHVYSSGFVRLSNATIKIQSASPINLNPQTVDLTQQVTGNIPGTDNAQ